jgi:hypothetical protein
LTVHPKLLRRGSRRFFRRLAFVGALAVMLLAAPSAGGLPAALDIQYTITSGTLGTNGWYVTNVTVKWTVTGETNSQGCDTQTLTVDTPGQTIACHAWNDTPPGPPIEEDATDSVTIKLDKTPPSPSIALERQPDANGWYNRPVTVAWAGADATSGIASCTATRYAGPDNSNGLAAGSCIDKAGNVAGSSFSFKYDATPPILTPAPSRAPDSNGWYTQALTVSFSGTDATSEVESCSTTAYQGADNPRAAVTGSCRDNAGNIGIGTFSFKFDATPPSVTNVRATPRNRSAQLSWRASPDTRLVEVRRAPGRNRDAESVVYRGSGSGFRDTGMKVGRRYRYRVTAFDDAANRASRSLAVTAAGPLFSPAPGARVGSPPRLKWTAVKGARYYNLQLMRGRKVLSAWPVRPGFQLRRTWIYNGRRYRLRPGVYRWYVWPGIGRISAGRFGRLLGSSTFVVTK